MLEATRPYVFLVVVLASGLPTPGSGSRADDFAAFFNAYKSCHPGYNGFTETQMAAAKKCEDMNIKSHNCFIACFLNEGGITKDGNWSDEGAKTCINQMWDPSEQYQAQREKWYQDTRACATKYAAKGGKWPTTYEGKCHGIDNVCLCVHLNRVCKT